MKRYLRILVLLLLAGAILASLLALRPYQKISGVRAVRLPARCELELYDQTVQPVATAVLACPGVNAIRLWPLPVLQPWYEDPLSPPEGIKAGSGTKVDGNLTELDYQGL